MRPVLQKFISAERRGTVFRTGRSGHKTSERLDESGFMRLLRSNGIKFAASNYEHGWIILVILDR